MRLSPTEAAVLDKRRGSLTRAAYLRSLLDIAPPAPAPSIRRAVTQARTTARHRHQPTVRAEPEDYYRPGGVAVKVWYCQCGIKIER